MSSLSLTGKRWILSPLHGRDGMPENDALALVSLLKHSRDIPASSSLSTSWYDAGLFPDAHKAAERVHAAIRAGEKIGIFGDYDCDGVTATAQMVRALRRAGNEPIIRLPHRVHDGYGLKPQHAEEFHAAGVTVLITVDTGVSAHAAIDRARERGIDTIILDHHHLLTPPNAYAILHPGLAPQYPHPHPSAAGVVFIFLHALEKGLWEDRDTDLILATLGTIADLVMLRGNNRLLVQEGLRAIQRLQTGPIKLLMDQVSAGKTITSTDIAFRVAPRINAAGRLADPMLALRALLDGGELLKDLETLNSLRQDQTSRALERAMLELTPNKDGELPAFLSIASASYPHGILGLLSGKLTERYCRPSMAIHIDGPLCTASMRSTPSYNIVEALERAKHLLITYGGHAQAAGATFALDNYLTLATFLEEDAAAHISADQLIPTLGVDAVIPAEAVTQNFCAHLTELEPYGQGNPEPLFLLEHVTLENMRRVGTDARHLQAQLKQCKIIGFGLGELMDQVRGPMDIVCRAGIDTWNGRMSPQLFLVDIRHAMGQKGENAFLNKNTIQSLAH